RRFVEDLERPDTEALDAIEFGALLHNVLECATRDDGLRLETAPERIEQQFADLLSQCSSDRFGSKRPTRIRVQERMLRRRLSAFAIVEAESRQSGWFTHEVEWSFRRGLSFGDSGEQQQIVGRIDRIDRHVETGRVRVLDYKSGEAGASPVSSHRVRDASGGWRWIDLQLPIYRHFFGEATGVPPDQIDVGYASIPRSIRDTRIVVASDWGQADFADAIQTAREVVAAIHRREFASSGSPWADEYANLCSMPGTPREMVQEGRAR
ncbi:MAG: PD-(D/E)XK nuclease family protein, partial [Phycisphaerales bacterium]